MITVIFVPVYVSACICALKYYNNNLFLMGKIELATVCLHCLSVTGTYTPSRQCLEANRNIII